MRTNAGRDLMARILGDPSSNGTGSYAPACYIGVSADGIAPGAGDTVLAGEIAAGTLARAQGVYAHTDGTATYTLTKTLTADQSVTLHKIGVFNAASGGSMLFEGVLNADSIMRTGDQVQVTVTVTL